MSKISLCMIVGNVEEYIQRCLTSFLPMCDEVVLVRAIGNNSPDRTMALAKELAALHGKEFKAGYYENKPECKNWPHVDNFAAARQMSFDLATGDYCFWCDSDDILLSGADIIREHANRGDYSCYVYPYAIHGKGINVPRERLIAKGCGKWNSPVHEHFVFAVNPPAAFEDDRVVVQHLPLFEKSGSNDRNLRILGSIHDAEMTTGLLYHYHLELAATGDIAKSVEVAQKALERPDIGKPEKVEIYLNLAQVATDPRHKHALFIQAYGADPRRREALMMLCNNALNFGSVEEGLAYARQMIATPRPSFREWNERAPVYEWLGDDMYEQALRANGLFSDAELVRRKRFLKRQEGCPRISLVHATRGRPEQSALARKIWLDTAAHPESVEHIFVFDSDDKESHCLRRFFHREIEPGGGCVAAWNAGASATGAPILVQMSDDWLPPHKWDDLICERIGNPEKPSVLAVSDGVRQDNLLCMAICTRQYMAQDYYLFHPEFTGVYSDNWFTHVAYKRGQVIEARDLVFKHNHPAFGEAKMDKTYAEQNAPKQYEKGLEIYNRLLTGDDWSDVPGFFNYIELYDIVAARLKSGDTIAEIGVWMGRSIIYLAQLLKRQGKRVKIYAVDTFAGELNQPVHEHIVKAHGGSLRAVFEANIKRCGVADMIEVVQSDSAEGAKSVADGSLAFCYIDAAHDYDSVRKDILAWKPKLKPGAIFAGHDMHHEPVQKAVWEIMPEAKHIGPCWLRLP